MRVTESRCFLGKDIESFFTSFLLEERKKNFAVRCNFRENYNPGEAADKPPLIGEVAERSDGRRGSTGFPKTAQ